MYFIYTKEPENIWEVSQAIKEQHVSKNIFLFVLKTQNKTIQDLKLFPKLTHNVSSVIFLSRKGHLSIIYISDVSPKIAYEK